jgi:hypothetical protein
MPGAEAGYKRSWHRVSEGHEARSERQAIGHPFRQQQPLVEQTLQVALQRSPVHTFTEGFKLLNGQGAVFQHMAQRNRLPLRQVVCLHEDVAMDRTPAWGVDPCHQVRHQRRHISRRRWRVDGFAGRRVDDVVLNKATVSWHRPVAPHAGDQSLGNLMDQAFRDRQVALQIVRHQLEGLAVVQQLPDIVRIGFRHGFAPHQPLGLFESELGPFDVCGELRG